MGYDAAGNLTNDTYTGQGPGSRVASDGKTMISADGLKQFGPPSLKPQLNKEQANFEWRQSPGGPWVGNGHLDIK